MRDEGLRFRPASISDACHLAVLVDIAGEGLASYFWGQMAGIGQSPLEIGRARAMRDDGAFTWRNATMAELDGEIAGALVGYLIPDTLDPEDFREASPIVRPLAELEAEAQGHWYVNVLAIFPEFRRRGLGAALLDLADETGSREGAIGMAIIVASENSGAMRLYRRKGYQEVSRRSVTPFPGYKRGGDWVLLTRPLP